MSRSPSSTCVKCLGAPGPTALQGSSLKASVLLRHQSPPPPLPWQYSLGTSCFYHSCHWYRLTQAPHDNHHLTCISAWPCAVSVTLSCVPFTNITSPFWIWCFANFFLNYLFFSCWNLKPKIHLVVAIYQTLFQHLFVCLLVRSLSIRIF